jgi:hypothetical protein
VILINIYMYMYMYTYKAEGKAGNEAKDLPRMVYIAPYYYSLAGMADPGKQGSG